MRRKTANALLGGGAFCLALAALTATVAQPALLKAPKENSVVTQSTGSASKLNATTRTYETIQANLSRTLTTHLEDGKVAGNGDVASYNEKLDLSQVGADGTVQSFDAAGTYTGLTLRTSVVAFDRKSGAGVPGAQGDTWDTTAQTVKFPFGAKKTTYELYDQTSANAYPVSFVKETKVNGLDVYEYFGTIPQVNLGQYGALAGVDQLYSNSGRTILVEPVTGSIVSQTTTPQISLEMADGTVTPALSFTTPLTPTDATIAERVADAKDSKSKAQLLQRAPWVLGALGLVLLVLGAGMTFRGRRSSTPDQSDRPDAIDLDAAPTSHRFGMHRPRNEAPLDADTRRG